jgi:hypothetical protein
MDEMTTVLSEDTTPAQEPEVESTPNEVEEPADTPEAEEQPTEEGRNNDVEPKETDIIDFKLRYNHEDISVNKDEAVRLAQIGMHFDKLGKKEAVLYGILFQKIAQNS